MILLGSLLAGLALVTGCAGGGRSPAPATTPSAGEQTGFPLTIQQEGGAVTLDRRPERVYVVDNWSLDLLVALGVQPAGAALNFPPSAWLAGAPQLQGVEVTTVTDALPFEKIAAARPDLIVDLSGFVGLDPATKTRLTALAPVLSPPRNSETDSWQDRLRHLGTALGRSADADKVIASGEQTVSDFKAKYPKLAGAALSFARMDPHDSFAIVAGPDDFTRRYLDTELGFTTPAAQAKAYQDMRFSINGGVIEGVSLERLDLLDADAAAVMIWFLDDKFLEALKRQRVWQDAPFVAEDRMVPLNIDAAIALRTPSPAALAWASDNLFPEIAAAAERAGS